MFFALSPAKNLDKKDPIPVGGFAQPSLLTESEILTETLRGLAPQQITELMHISDKTALLNAEHNTTWHTPFISDNARQAAFMFNDDVYEGLDTASFIPERTDYLQQHACLLSGLYGVLHPLDLIQPYRLEMDTPPTNPCGKNLCEFRGGRITGLLNDTLARAGVSVLANLTSQEYFRSVDTRKLNARLITPVSKDEESDKYKIISFYVKHACGLMVCYATEHGVTDPEQLKGFDYEGYRFDGVASGANE